MHGQQNIKICLLRYIIRLLDSALLIEPKGQDGSVSEYHIEALSGSYESCGEGKLPSWLVWNDSKVVSGIKRQSLAHGSGVPRNFVRGRGVQQIQLRTEDTENGDLGAVAP